jgi:hypothetical protein
VTTSPDRALLEAIAALGRALADLGAPYMIIGGIAVIARGVPRHTVDVDATVWAPDLEVDAILAALDKHGIAGRIPDVAAFAREHQVFLLRHQPSGTPMELSRAWMPFEQDAIARAGAVDFKLARLPVAQPEDLVVYKTIAWRDRDRADIEALVLAHRGSFAMERVRATLAEFAEALDEPERLEDFDRLIAKVLAPAGATRRGRRGRK